MASSNTSGTKILKKPPANMIVEDSEDEPLQKKVQGTKVPTESGTSKLFDFTSSSSLFLDSATKTKPQSENGKRKNPEKKVNSGDSGQRKNSANKENSGDSGQRKGSDKKDSRDKKDDSNSFRKKNANQLVPSFDYFQSSRVFPRCLTVDEFYSYVFPSTFTFFRVSIFEKFCDSANIFFALAVRKFPLVKSK